MGADAVICGAAASLNGTPSALAKPASTDSAHSQCQQQMTRSIIYGSIATPLKKADTDHTHRWTVYVRGFHGEDISTYIRRITFRLHESFSNPSRTIETAPFEVSETGWGEFQLQIKLVFQDPLQKPVQLVHHLRLYPVDTTNGTATGSPSESVISEHYEEIVFDPPTEAMATIFRSEQHKFNNWAASPKAAGIAEAEKLEQAQLQAAIQQINEQIALLESHQHAKE